MHNGWSLNNFSNTQKDPKLIFKITFHGIPYKSTSSNLINTLILSKFKKKIVWKLMEEMNHYKNSGMQNPFKELSFLI